MPPSPSPPTTPSTPAAPTTLAHQINSATRRTHTTLNKHILHLLPLALPPFTNNAYIYAQGMSCILPIYHAFESSFSQLLALPPALRTPLIDALATLHIPALERTIRLRQDLQRLSPSSSFPLQQVIPPSGNSTTTAERDTKSTTPLLTAFTAHITNVTRTRPHLLLAYTHIFYLALFSGGRYIRAQLRRATAAPVSDDDDDDLVLFPEEALRFWYFDDGGVERGKGKDMDGEALKEEFKRRFRDVENILSREEKEEVVREAVRVMEEVVGVVGEIEGVVGSGRGMEMRKGDNNGNNDDLGGASTKKSLAAERKSWAREDEQDVSVRRLLLKHLLPLGLADLVLAGFGGVLRLGFQDGSLGPGNIGSDGRSFMGRGVG